MTDKQVEELHAQHALVVGNDMECPHGERQGYCDRCEYEHSILYDMVLNALPRLLEERKRLRIALVEVLFDNRPGAGAEDRAHKALSFADEDAP